MRRIFLLTTVCLLAIWLQVTVAVFSSNIRRIWALFRGCALDQFGSGRNFWNSSQSLGLVVSLFINVSLVGSHPNPRGFLTTFAVDDPRCFCTLPKFDRLGFYKGPLPKQCGHVHEHKLIGKSNSQWNTAPSASYPPQLCEFLAQLILNAKASCGGGGEDEPQSASSSKRRRLDKLPGTVDQNTAVRDKRPGTLGQGESAEQGPTVDTAASTTESTTANNCSDVGDGVHDQFDMFACCNAGRPIQVEWDQVHRGFIDGFGLCSPCRWRPAQRGERRAKDMVQLANDTFQILSEAVKGAIKDLRLEAFKLVTGKLQHSPFSDAVLRETRNKWFQLLTDPTGAAVVDEGQPFFLRALAQWLKQYQDPDAHWLTDVDDSFASGVYVGVDRALPRSPQIFSPEVETPQVGRH